MQNTFPLLLVPEKMDPESDAVIKAWQEKGGKVRRLGKFWIRNEEIAAQKTALYGNQTFSLVLAQIYNLKLISPADTLITLLDSKWTGRKVLHRYIHQVQSFEFPVFIKPVIPKLFLANVFQSMQDFEIAVSGLREIEEVLVSNIVHITAEARSFVLNGSIHDIALYEGEADLEKGKKFLQDFIEAHKKELPSTVVIDLAYAPKMGWFILEFNACWGAGLNGCQAEKVVDCIVQATQRS